MVIPASSSLVNRKSLYGIVGRERTFVNTPWFAKNDRGPAQFAAYHGGCLSLVDHSYSYRSASAG